MAQNGPATGAYPPEEPEPLRLLWLLRSTSLCAILLWDAPLCSGLSRSTLWLHGLARLAVASWQKLAPHGSRVFRKRKAGRSGQLFVCLPLPATDNEKLALLQSPQHIVELIKTAVANGQYAAAFGFIDADSKAERIRYAFFQRNQISVFRSAAAHGASAT